MTKPSLSAASNNNWAHVRLPMGEKIKLEPSAHGGAPDGHSSWVEYGSWYHAPTVPDTYGAHDYVRSGVGIGDCKCGCYMSGGSSSGTVDPFGPCPLQPPVVKEDTDSLNE